MVTLTEEGAKARPGAATRPGAHWSREGSQRPPPTSLICHLLLIWPREDLDPLRSEGFHSPLPADPSEMAVVFLAPGRHPRTRPRLVHHCPPGHPYAPGWVCSEQPEGPKGEPDPGMRITDYGRWTPLHGSRVGWRQQALTSVKALPSGPVSLSEQHWVTLQAWGAVGSRSIFSGPKNNHEGRGVCE